ncbi:MAG: DUF1641 domain-containing protein [Desulforhopalus sp.]|nr:DUF1641 domain-containing protein [Desulforhopalus sp.]
MDEALILKKLDALSNEIQTLKADVVAELKKEILPLSLQTGPLVADCLSDLDQENRREDLVHFMRNLVLNVETLNALLSTAKGAMELKNELEPVAKQVYPKVTELFSDMEGQYDLEEIAALLRNTLSNVHHLNTAVTMLKSGMELKDEIEPIAKLVLPKTIELFAEMEGQYSVDDITTLVRNTLSNLHHFNTAITMLKAGMELVDEIEPVAKLSLPGIIDLFSQLEGTLKVAGGAMGATLKGCTFSEQQAEAMCNVIAAIDLSKPNKLGPVGLVKKLYDPKIQETLGMVFTLLEAVGALLQAHRDNR